MRHHHGQSVSRREFLRKAAVGAVGAAALLPASSRPAQAQAVDDSHRVVIVRHAGVTRDYEVQEEVLAQIVDRAVQDLCGEQSAQRAWERYFSADERVGVKVNGLGGPSMATSVVLTQICVERLQGIGVKPESIIIWDSNPGFLGACGLEPGTRWGAQVLTMDTEWDPIVQQGSFRGPITAIVTKRVDSFLNLPIVKDHAISGITLAMKNHYGTHANPEAHHDNSCDPYIADLNTIPAIRDKQRLIICDGTRGQAQGGPSYNPQFAWEPHLVMAAVDRVAHDTVGWQLIEAQRASFGLPTLEAAGRPPKQLQSAADRGLGTNRLEEIDQVEVTLS